MRLPLNEIVTRLNKKFRHRFPTPQIAEENYITALPHRLFEVACPNCFALLHVSSRNYSYSIRVNNIAIDQWEYDIFDKQDFETVLCGKLSAFL